MSALEHEVHVASEIPGLEELRGLFQAGEHGVIVQRLRGTSLSGLPASHMSLLGQAQVALGHKGEGAQSFAQLTRLQPAVARWWFLLGKCLLQLSRHKDAFEALQEARRLAPRWIACIYYLGRAAEALGKTAEALEAFRTSVDYYNELLPDKQGKLSLFFVAACKRTAAIVAKQPSPSRAALREATTCLETALQLQPEDSLAYYRLGVIRLLAGEIEKAIPVLETARKLDPRSEYIIHRLAQALARQGQTAAALEAYGSIPEGRRPAYIWRAMGLSLLETGQTLEAARCFYRAVKREPHKGYHHLHLGDALMRLGARDQAIMALKEANRSFNEESHQNNAKALKLLAQVEVQPNNTFVKLDEEEEPTEIRTGIITRYNTQRGFGFIRDDKDGKELFFHISMVKRDQLPTKGNRVRFSPELNSRTDRGPRASRVWITSQKLSPVNPHPRDKG